MIQKIAYTIARLIAVILMGQTFFFKFTGAPESVYIFERIGMEPWGRWLIGILELAACILIIIPKMSKLGGLMTVVIMLGAIIMHLAILGIEVMNDGGLLFYYALIVFISGLYIFITKKNLGIIKKNK